MPSTEEEYNKTEMVKGEHGTKNTTTVKAKRTKDDAVIKLQYKMCILNYKL